MHISSESKVSLGRAFMSFMKISEGDVQKILNLEQGEYILEVSFGRVHKNFIIQMDSNLYLTNKRLLILQGSKLTTIWFETVQSLQLMPSTIWETIYVMGKFDSLIVEYNSDKGIKKLRYWCSNGVIGTAPTPNNDKTREIFKKIENAKENI